ncbi:MAG: hypothetical protein KDE22_07940 [Rhodobacterales bacterium]|nr:hypothetical protein [Rhodobacterales bacterium]
MKDPIARILADFPADFFKGLVEQMDAAFAKALLLTRKHYDEPERANMLGQARHACCEEAFRAAAQDAGVAAIAPHTHPAGGRYSLVSSKGVHLIRGNVQAHCGPPRPTRFRSAWAELNAWLNPIQLDLLKTVPMPSSEQLCGVIVVTAHRRNSDPSIPAFVGLGIPRSDLSEWVLLEPVHKLLARYHDLETKARTMPEAPVEVKDRAIPRLKKTSDRDPKD